MNLEDFRQHVDKRFDKLEEKIDVSSIQIVVNTKDVEWLKGHAKMVITIVIALAGFFALAFFDNIKGMMK